MEGLRSLEGALDVVGTDAARRALGRGRAPAESAPAAPLFDAAALHAYLEAGKTIILEKEKVIHQATDWGIQLVGY